MKFNLLLLLLASAARGDTVYLANGNTMKGVVVSRGKTQIVLDIGYGTVTLNAADVVKIVRGTGADAGLKSARFSAGEKIPAGARTLDETYRRAESRREKALDAKAQDKTLAAEDADIRRRLPDEKETLRRASADLAGQSPSVDPRGYNESVAAVNSASASIQADQLRLEQIDDERRAVEAEVRRYLDAWRALDAALKGTEARTLAAGSAGQKDYLAWLRSQSRAMSKDFREDSVVSQTRGDQVIVAVVVNGKAAGQFLVDTGATTTLLYAATAARLGLGPESVIGKSRSRVADGREIDADVVRLDSIQVGSSRVDGSLAVVVAGNDPHFDGLLGMSFLSRFVARVDPVAGRLILEDLRQPDTGARAVKPDAPGPEAP
ncbi:MAG: retroviral-like aspartic protease family protein [Elusimicrobia bacterium]|nr:retroviral-like aspartic protease family protein [Elusimicrobiota bacterium]